MTIEVNLKATGSFSHNIYFEISPSIGILKSGKKGGLYIL
jgi:hypothetical protein